MKLSSRSKYAITAMIELALRQPNQPLTLLELSGIQQISLSYLEQLFACLREKGLVKGRRGPGGGYVLAQPAQDITVADIVDAIDHNDRPEAEASAGSNAASEVVWNRLSDKIYRFLSEINLAQLLEADTQHSRPEEGTESALPYLSRAAGASS